MPVNYIYQKEVEGKDRSKVKETQLPSAAIKLRETLGVKNNKKTAIMNAANKEFQKEIVYDYYADGKFENAEGKKYYFNIIKKGRVKQKTEPFKFYDEPEEKRNKENSVIHCIEQTVCPIMKWGLSPHLSLIGNWKKNTDTQWNTSLKSMFQEANVSRAAERQRLQFAASGCLERPLK